LSTADINRPLQNLELPFNQIELPSRIQQAYLDRSLVLIPQVELKQSENNTLYLDIQIIPLFDNNANILGVTIVFNDVTSYHQLQQELQKSAQELEKAYESLQSTNEELETTNEELQSTNEELETTNEELQSTNEELETMNEELQSANEELQTTNSELSQCTEEINQMSVFMESILSSVQVGMVVLDNHLTVQVWNSKAEDLWGLRAQEAIGFSFFDLDISLPIEERRELILACQIENSSEQIKVLDIVNRRGKTIRCRVTCTVLLIEKKRQGITILIDELTD